MPASTNFQQWNPTKANQENDSTYATDTTRLGGITTGSTFPSPLADKAFYQWSTFIGAFGIMMRAKGYTTSDADISALAAVLANVLTWADLGFLNNIVTVAYSPNPVFDASQGTQFYILLNGNVTGATLINSTPGQKLTFMIKQDTSGGHSFAWPSNMFAGGSPQTNANGGSTQQFQVWADGGVTACTPMVTYP